MSSCRRITMYVSVSLALMSFVAEGQSSVAVSPFVSYVPSATVNPLAGFALTFGGTTGLALRSSAELSISNPTPVAASTGGYRPWGADADAMLFLGGLGGGATVFNRSLSPYLFSGLGITGGDSSGVNVVRHGWSYGLGAAIPLGFDADIFAEARWRMSQYVLPTSHDAPDSKSEMRFGLSFHVGGGGTSSEPPRRSPRRRYRDDVAQSTYEPEVVAVAPAPVERVVVVQQPVEPAPQVVVISQEPEPRRTVQIVRAPQPIVVIPTRARRTQRVYVASPSVRITRRTRRPD